MLILFIVEGRSLMMSNLVGGVGGVGLELCDTFIQKNFCDKEDKEVV